MADEVRVDRYWNNPTRIRPFDLGMIITKATYKSRAPRSDIIYRNTSVQIWVVFELADTRTQRLASVPDRKTLIVSWSSCLPRPAHLTETSNEIFDTDVHEYICPWIFHGYSSSEIRIALRPPHHNQSLLATIAEVRSLKTRAWIYSCCPQSVSSPGKSDRIPVHRLWNFVSRYKSAFQGNPTTTWPKTW